MQVLRRSLRPAKKPINLPLWVLIATAPVVVSVGLLVGIAAAIYWAPLGRGSPPVTAGGLEPGHSPEPTPSPAGTLAPAPSITPSPMPHPTPIPTPFPAPVQPSVPTPAPTPITVRDARNELARSFSTFQAGMVTIGTIDYQQMINRAQSTSIVGILSLDSYADWNRALDIEPQRLEAWLESAARAVLPATSSDRIFLSWSVVDVRATRPLGFADHEVTELSNGTFLVIRPLASTLSHTEPVVTLRTRDNLTMSPLLGPNAGGPWATYTPVLNFDSTDKYRPPTTAGTRPR